MNQFCAAALFAVLGLAELVAAAEPAATSKPLIRDFVGVNGHTIQFKPELYKQVCSVVRDYHPLEWDTGSDSSYTLNFPSARNGVNWEQVYGSWRKYGFYNDVCIMFETLPAEKWKSLANDSFNYGQRFATSFGPSSKLALVDAVEIGNEPGKFSDDQYRTVFTNMTRGLRQGDKRLKVATCNVNVGPSGDYHKSVECVAGLEDAYDVLTIHSYALLEGWPTWKRSFPEDKALPAFTQDVDRLIEWRDEHARGKEIWLTEFGWDSCTQEPPTTGDFSQWVDNSDTQQAQWLVRSLLLFSKRDVQRAFIYFFNDQDAPQFHGSSGLTRNFVPKPSFHAVGHFTQTLGDYRFSKVVRESYETGFVYQYAHSTDSNRAIIVAWSPSGSQQKIATQVELNGMKVVAAERMPLGPDGPDKMEPQSIAVSDGKASLTLEESPLYLMLTR